MSVEQAEGGVQADGHPDAVADPGQLPHLALLAGVSVEGLLLQGDRTGGVNGKTHEATGFHEATTPAVTSILMALGWMT